MAAAGEREALQVHWTLQLLLIHVNLNEWNLDTSISATGRSKVLQFVVYVYWIIYLISAPKKLMLQRFRPGTVALDSKYQKFTDLPFAPFVHLVKEITIFFSSRAMGHAGLLKCLLLCKRSMLKPIMYHCS